MFLIPLENTSPDDQAFFNGLYEKYCKLMFHKAGQYITNPADLEDVIQDTIVKLLRIVPTLRRLTGATLTSYIVITVKNTALNHLRREALKNKHKHIIRGDDTETETEIDIELIDPAPSPEELLLISERKAEFIRIWNMLPERDRDLLNGKYGIELSDTELAELFDCKPDSVRVLLARARKRALSIMTKESCYDES